MNNNGIAVGSAAGGLPGISGNPQVAVYWGAGDVSPTRLPDVVGAPPSGPSSIIANGINEDGAIAGETRAITGGFDAVFWPGINEPGQVLPDSEIDGTPLRSRRASDVHEDGTIVGHGTLGFRDIPMAWNSQREPLVLPSPIQQNGGLITAQAKKINSRGQILGDGYVLEDDGSGTMQRGLRWDAFDKAPVVLDSAPLFGKPGFRNSARDINDFGTAVGFTFVIENSVLTSQGVVWDSQGADFILDELVDNIAGYTVTNAYGINNNGWIVGAADSPTGSRVPVMLVPVPEPSATAPMLLLGVLSALVTRRR